MNTTTNIKTADHPDMIAAASDAAQAVRDLLDALSRRGLPVPAILAGAHAEIVSAMVCAYGGAATIERMVGAADRIEHLPSAAQVQLMTIETQGRA